MIDKSKPEQGLFSSEENFCSFFKAVDDMIFVSDEMGNILFTNPALMAVGRVSDRKFTDVNEAFLNKLGFRRDEVIGKTSRELGLFPEQGKQEEIAHELEETGEIGEYTLKVRTKSGELLDGLFSGTLIESQGKRYFLTTMIDLTLQVRAQKKLDQQRELLQVLSHDLKEPLRAIGSYSDLIYLKNRDKLDDSSEKRLHSLKKTARGMQKLVDDLVTITSLGEVASHKPLEIPKLVDEIAQQFYAQYAEISVQEDFPTVIFGESQLKIILKNLLENATKYNDPPRKVRLGYQESPKKDSVAIFVKDNGYGIPEKYRQKIFNMFERLDNHDDSDGTGSGLSFCKRILEANGFKIWLESKEGQGSTFYFTLKKSH